MPASARVGPVGPVGPAGPGVAEGGSSGQFLRKASGTDFDTLWGTPGIVDVTGLQAALDLKATTTYVDAGIAAIEADLAAHAALTEDVHGTGTVVTSDNIATYIADLDTAGLATDAALQAHADATEDVHGSGIVVTSDNIGLYAPAPDLTPYAPLAGAAFTGNVSVASNRTLGWASGPTLSRTGGGAVDLNHNLIAGWNEDITLGSVVGGGSAGILFATDIAMHRAAAGTLQVQGTGAGVQTKFVAKGSAAQSNEIFQVQDSAGASMFSVAPGVVSAVTGYFQALGDIYARVSGGDTRVAIGAFGPASEAAIKLGSDVVAYRKSANILGLSNTYLHATHRVRALDGGSARTEIGDVGPGAEAGLALGSAADVVLWRQAAKTFALGPAGDPHRLNVSRIGYLNGTDLYFHVGESASVAFRVRSSDTYHDLPLTGGSGSAFRPSASAAQVPLILKGAASQSANLQEWRNSADSVLARIAADGTIYGAMAPSVIYSGGDIHARNGGADRVAIGDVVSGGYPGVIIANGELALGRFSSGVLTLLGTSGPGAAPAGVTFVTKLIAAQSVNAFEVRNSADVVLSHITAAGALGSPAGSLVRFVSTNGQDININAARAASVDVATNQTFTINGNGNPGVGMRLYGWQQYAEVAAAPAAQADAARLYAIDNGGKTELRVLFGTGASVLIAAEP